MRRPFAECRRHRPALIAIAARREPVPDRSAVLDHVDRCRRCADELQELALAVIALRRLGQLPAGASVSPSAWPELRDRIERSRAAAAALAWRWRTTLAGLATGTLVVAALVAPTALHVQGGVVGAEPVGYSPHELDLLSRRVEMTYVLDARTGTLTTPTVTTGSQGGIPRRYPDGITPVGKEVPPRPTGRPPSVH